MAIPYPLRPMPDQQMSRLLADVPERLHLKLRVKAAYGKQCLKDALIDVLEDYFQRHPLPELKPEDTAA